MNKRIWLVLAALAATVSFAAAQDQPVADPQQELTAALQAISGTQIGTLTVADLTGIASRVSVARQEQAYIQRVSRASLRFPGVGQLMTGNTLGGVLFLTGDVAVMAGAMVGAYFLLPANLRFDALNYYTTNIGDIKTAWQNHSIADYLPSLGVMAGGMLLKGILGHVSSRLAAEEARKNIASGKVTFTPRLGFDGSGLMLGFGIRM